MFQIELQVHQRHNIGGKKKASKPVYSYECNLPQTIDQFSGSKKQAVKGELNDENKFVSLNISGKKIDLSEYLTNEKNFGYTANNFLRMFGLIEKEQNLSKLISNQAVFKTKDGYRFNFSLVDASGKKEEYIGTRNDVYKIVEKASKLTEAERLRLE